MKSHFSQYRQEMFTTLLLIHGPPYPNPSAPTRKRLEHIAQCATTVDQVGFPRAGFYSDYRQWCKDNGIPLQER
jgi:hypothetical protein